MTTSVTIKACCAVDIKEVKITITDNNEIVEDFIIQDGVAVERFIYDDRTISVREIEKS